MTGKYLRVRHKATGETAIALRRPDGLMIVQFDRYPHPLAHGWHLFPRHHFHRLKGRAMNYDAPVARKPVPYPEPPCVVGNQAGWYP
jgi:hypothetical protein